MNQPHALSTEQLTTPQFSIITVHHGRGDGDDPIFCAVASLADQESTKSEQILQHSGGVVGLWNKLSKELALSKRAPRYTLRLLETKESSFYDALQSAITRATGTFVGFLPPEAQYLPGALITVEKYFQAHPEVEVVVTGAFLQQEKKAEPATSMGLEYFWTNLPFVHESTLFFRRSLLEKEIPFHAQPQHIIFTEWLLRVFQAKKNIGYLNLLTTMVPKEITPSNKQDLLSLPPAPTGMKLLAPWWKWRYQSAQQQAKKSLPSVACLVYQASSLTQRTELMK